MVASLKEIQADLWVFDNDGTLYTNTQEIKLAVEGLMVCFIGKEYNTNFSDAAQLRRMLLAKHNTKYTAVALRREGIDVERFIEDTYLSVDPKDCGICRRPALYDLISSLGGKKIVLTNNPSGFARRILRALEVDILFSDVFGMEELDFVLKPAKEAFAILEKPLESGQSVVVVDDNPNNLQVAKAMGCLTILVGDKRPGDFVPDAHLISLT